jgi:Proteasome complex subunit Rpn13 ubiquitin receptor
MVKVRWTDLTTNTIVDDYFVMPQDVILKKVTTGKENDRVYLLKWLGAGVDRKLMFWMQDKSPEKDDENCKKFNDFIANPNAQPAVGRKIIFAICLFQHLRYSCRTLFQQGPVEWTRSCRSVTLD